ncbi:MAG: hypothetical protein V4850_29425 [Myxococcota bacterium]
MLLTLPATPAAPAAPLNASGLLSAVRRVPIFAVVRVAIGVQLAVHYARLYPWATTLYSDQGMLADPARNPVALGFSPLHHLDAPWMIQAVVLGLVGLSLAFAAGLFTRTAGVLLALGAATLWHRNMLTLNPSLPYLGFFLLAHAFARPNPPWSIDRWRARRAGGSAAWCGFADRLPRDVLGALWVVFTVGYSFSGYTKLVSPSWADGSAVARMLRGPIALDNPLVHALAALPDAVLAVATWGTLGLELLAAPLALSRRLRPALWLALFGMHAGLLGLVGLQDISWGMLVTHLALFDPRWLRRRAASGELRR